MHNYVHINEQGNSEVQYQFQWIETQLYEKCFSNEQRPGYTISRWNQIYTSADEQIWLKSMKPRQTEVHKCNNETRHSTDASANQNEVHKHLNKDGQSKSSQEQHHISNNIKQCNYMSSKDGQRRSSQGWTQWRPRDGVKSKCRSSNNVIRNHKIKIYNQFKAASQNRGSKRNWPSHESTTWLSSKESIFIWTSQKTSQASIQDQAARASKLTNSNIFRRT